MKSPGVSWNSMIFSTPNASPWVFCPRLGNFQNFALLIRVDGNGPLAWSIPVPAPGQGREWTTPVVHSRPPESKVQNFENSPVAGRKPKG